MEVISGSKHVPSKCCNFWIIIIYARNRTLVMRDLDFKDIKIKVICEM